jgi:hypothetical protein
VAFDGRNQFNSWGSPQVPYLVRVCAEQSKLLALSVELKPLGASNIGSDSKGCSHSTRKQRKLFYVRENSASCSTFEKTARAVHQNEWQRKLFIRTSGSESCSSERVAAKAVHQNECQRKLFIRTSGSNSCSQD